VMGVSPGECETTSRILQENGARERTYFLTEAPRSYARQRRDEGDRGKGDER
jgi:hypothetical protein